MRAIRKLFTFSCHLAIAYLIVRFTLDALASRPTAYKIALDASRVSSVYLLLMGVQARHLLRTYGNIFSRLLLRESLIAGFILAGCELGFGVAEITSGQPHVGFLPVWYPAFIGVVHGLFWTAMLASYLVNKQRYEIRGAGPVPVDTCTVIPPELPQPGDAIGTGGQMAILLHQGVAHTETVILWEGRTMLFSSWFENGAFLNEVSRILKPNPKYPNYLLQRRPALRPDQLAMIEPVVRSMIRQNAAFVERVKARRARMPAFLRKLLDKQFPVTGYDWLGRYTGRRAPDRWTCNVVYLEVMRRIGVEVVRLGQGAAGLRTGWFDIPNTEDLRGDNALHLVRNAEVPGLLAATSVSGSSTYGGPAKAFVSGGKRDLKVSQADFDAEVERLVGESTNIFSEANKSKRRG